jgi:hypothetical protein
VFPCVTRCVRPTLATDGPAVDGAGRPLFATHTPDGSVRSAEDGTQRALERPAIQVFGPTVAIDPLTAG